jgi:DNA-binding NarL/FixJ family response regulator
MTIRVLVVDDQELVRSGLRMIVDAQPDLEVVAEAADGREGIEACRCRPDVVLMDIRMPNLDGVEATRRIAGPDVPVADRARVLILTTFDLDEYVVDALRAGASGFMIKDAPPADLARAIRVVAAGDAMLAPSVTRRLIGTFVGRGQTLASRAVLDQLTERELEVLKLLARGLSNAQIAEELVLGEATIKTHVARVLDKLELQNRVQAAILAYETGLVELGTR